MTFTPVESTTLTGIGYDAALRILYLEFVDNSAYRYHQVPLAIYEELMSAPSKGVCFNRMIRGRFAYERCRRIPQPPAPAEEDRDSLS